MRSLFGKRARHRAARIWSNAELRTIAPHVEGDVANVSGWKDEDKEGRRYRDYFTSARSYTITNYRSEARGFQNAEGEVFLDLEQPLPADLAGRFDAVFNHTVLEHVYDHQTAFDNLCRMSRDLVILVVPFLQPYHSDYGDYWRFSPLAVKRMFEAAGVEPISITFNEHWLASTYVFGIGSKQAMRWRDRFRGEFTLRGQSGMYAGELAFPPTGTLLRRLVRGRSSR